MNRRRNLMDLAIANELNPDERAELRALLESDPAAREEFLRMQSLAGEIEASAYRSFGPSFSDRVMQRLGKRAEARSFSFADLLAPLFYRVAGAALALAVMIGVYNVTLSSGADQTPIEAALGLPSASMESAYESALGSIALNEESR